MSEKTKCPMCGGPAHKLMPVDYGYDQYISTAPAEIARAQREAANQAIIWFYNNVSNYLMELKEHKDEFLDKYYPAPGGETDG